MLVNMGACWNDWLYFPSSYVENCSEHSSIHVLPMRRAGKKNGIHDSTMVVWGDQLTKNQQLHFYQDYFFGEETTCPGI